MSQDVRLMQLGDNPSYPRYLQISKTPLRMSTELPGDVCRQTSRILPKHPTADNIWTSKVAGRIESRVVVQAIAFVVLSTGINFQFWHCWALLLANSWTYSRY